MSSNNHELTKLFYQLPGGTKSLVQNAIQSQNGVHKLNKNQKTFQTTSKKPIRKNSQFEKKNTTPNKLMKAELPGI